MKFVLIELGIGKLLAVTLFAVGLHAGDAMAQEFGNGVTSGLQRQLQQAQQHLPGTQNTPNFFNEGNSQSAVRNPFSGLFKNSKLPGLDGLKQKAQGDKPDLSNSFNELLSKRDPSRQNFFQKMNSKSKDLFQKTKGWAKGKGAGARGKSTETWNNVMRDFNANKARLGKVAPVPVQPNFRSAEAIGEPKLRF